MSTHEQLPACLVCGGEARLNRDGYSLDFRVRCDECGARTEDFETDKEAIAAWNRRATPSSPVPDGWVEIARAALEPFADVSGEGDEDFPDDTPVTARFGRTTHLALKLGDFRRAFRALHGGPR